MQGEQEQNYDTSVTSDAAHGKPVTAPFGNGQSAISLILASDGAATVPSYCSGSLNFELCQPSRISHIGRTTVRDVYNRRNSKKSEQLKPYGAIFRLFY